MDIIFYHKNVITLLRFPTSYVEVGIFSFFQTFLQARSISESSSVPR